MTTNIYHSPHRSRTQEASFFQTLRKSLPGATHVASSYLLDRCSLDHFVDTRALINALRKDLFLPVRRKEALVRKLEVLPGKIRIALSPTQVSCDFVVVASHQPFFIEFHEKQHRNLSVARASPVYSSDGDRHDVPRYVQRFLRDIWRIQALPSFTIIWFDWFSNNNGNSALKFTHGFHEFAEPDCFSFSNLLGIDAAQ